MIDDLLQRHLPDRLGPNRSLVGIDLIRNGQKSILPFVLRGQKYLLGREANG